MVVLTVLISITVLGIDMLRTRNPGRRDGSGRIGVVALVVSAARANGQ